MQIKVLSRDREASVLLRQRWIYICMLYTHYELVFACNDVYIHTSLKHPIQQVRAIYLLLMEEIPNNHLRCEKTLQIAESTTNLNWWTQDFHQHYTPED